MSIKIENLKIEELKFQKTPELDILVKLMAKHGTKNAYDLLPTSIKHYVSMHLNNTYSAFANAIRRTLIDDIPVLAMNVIEKDIDTDDEFISGMNDVLIKNLSLIPIMQSGNVTDNSNKYDVYLSVFNNTNEIIDVKASDIIIVLKTQKKKKKGGHLKESRDSDESLDKVEVEDKNDADVEDKNESADDSAEFGVESLDVEDKTEARDLEVEDKNSIKKKKAFELIPDDNILIARLRPGKYLKLRNIHLQSGTSSQNAGKYSLLNNITYEPLDIQPYDQFTNKGTRSIEHNCKSFLLEFTTCGNITPKEIMDKVHVKLSFDLSSIKKKIQLYSESGAGSYYRGQDCEITIHDDVYNFKFVGNYISEIFMISMCCFQLDANIPFCTATVERFDSLVGILRIMHADTLKLLLKAIDTCQLDLNILNGMF